MKKYLKYIFFGIITIIILPILVNFLASITVFKSIVVGEESIWISFFSSYLGGILGGVFTLIGVIMTINYQNNTIKVAAKTSKEKNRKIIDSIIDRSFSDLLFFLAYDTKKFELEQTDYEKMNFILKRLLRSNQEVQQFDLHSIDDDFIADFIRIRELLDILTLSIEEVYTTKNSPKEFQKELIKINLNRRTVILLESYLNITSNKDLIQGVIDDLKKLV